MDEPKIEDLSSHLKEYVKVQYELVELQLIERTAVSGSGLISRLVITLVILFSVLFLSVGFAFYLSQLLRSLILSFLLIGVGYLLIALLFMMFRKQWLVRPFRNRIINGLTHKA